MQIRYNVVYLASIPIVLRIFILFQMKVMQQTSRIVFLDWLRMIAIFAVILVHCIEPFYLGGPEGTFIASRSDALWVTLINSALRAAVPLFVLASSYLLFPVKTDTVSFFKRRVSRVLVPFVIWSLLYCVIPPFGSDGEIDVAGNFRKLVFNFVMTGSGHLWFVYMILGVYLLMPMLSPWIEKISRKEEKAFLCLWAFTTVLPVFRPLAETVTGSTALWGECPWNPFGTFYYVSGFVGYLVLGHYIRTYASEVSWGKTLAFAIPFWIVGYAVTAGGYWHFMPRENGFPLSEPYEAAVLMETTWNFCTFGVMMQTVAYFLVIKKITASGWFYTHIVQPVSKLSYGMYLMHMFALVPVFAMVSSWNLPTPLVMIVSALITFVVCAVVTRLLVFIPRSKYIVG